MKLWEWFKGLGRRRTLNDPDGKKHQLGFIAFCLAMLVLIGVLIAIQSAQADEARAATGICYADKTLTNYSATSTPWIRLRVHGMCGTNRGPNARFTVNPQFVRTYGENAVWNFEKWFPNASTTGVATAPNGDRNVAFSSRWVAGEFTSCFPPVPCMHSPQRGVRITAWANGLWQGATTLNVEPYTPVPRP